MSERSGIVNIGIEGMMLTAAFVGFMAAMLVDEAMPDAEPGAFFGATPALLVGVLAAIGAGMLVSLAPCLAVDLGAGRPDHQRHGDHHPRLRPDRLPESAHPAERQRRDVRLVPARRRRSSDLPILGWLLTDCSCRSARSRCRCSCSSSCLQVLLFRSRWGLRTRAVGEHPRAADTVGVNVIRLRYRNVILGGIFAGLAGAWLTLEANASFQNGMTANRGFIALAAVIFGRWTPIGAFGGALLFGFSEAIGIAIRSDPPPGDLGVWLSGIQGQYPSLYNNFFSALPYVLTIIVLAGVVGRSIPPAAVGKPYVKEGAH